MCSALVSRRFRQSSSKTNLVRDGAGVGLEPTKSFDRLILWFSEELFATVKIADKIEARIRQSQSISFSPCYF